MSFGRQFSAAASSLEAEYPFETSATTPFFPPVCLTSHWNPTNIYKRTVPDQKVGLPLDFRPYAKICLEYRTTGPEEALPATPADLVFPMGGEFYPPNRYSEAIDNESALRRLDRPLRLPERDDYVPALDSDMYNREKMAPPRTAPTSRMVQELAMPQALLRIGAYDCRDAEDKKAQAAESKPFNNPTKMAKFNGKTFVN
jgi:hypothetical protein